jgi:hypothetical protein
VLLQFVRTIKARGAAHGSIWDPRVHKDSRIRYSNAPLSGLAYNSSLGQLAVPARAMSRAEAGSGWAHTGKALEGPKLDPLAHVSVVAV